MSAARATVLLLALALGSWVGLGAPRGHAQAGGPPEVRPALASDPPPVDATLLPDPTPWPQLNPTANVTRAWLLAEGPLALEGSGERVLTFTFDDGPFPETTPVVLHVLAKHHVRATFFWIGRYLDGDSPRAEATRLVAQEVERQGHLIGNHTHDHHRLTILDHARQVAQVDEGSASIARVTGKRPVFFRPPYGQLDAYSEDLLRARGQTLVLWSVEAGDMKSDDVQGMVDSLREQIEYAGGGIVLLHDIRFTSAEALDRLLTWLDLHRFDPSRPERVGYDVVDLPEYLRRTAAHPQPFEGREELEKARALAWRELHPDGTSQPPAGRGLHRAAGTPAAAPLADEPLM